MIYWHRCRRFGCGRRAAAPILAAACIAAGASASAQQASQADLEDKVQNPVAALISVPFQNNTYFGLGRDHDSTANVLNIQPVIPIPAGDWNIISRTIVPLIYVPHINFGGSPGDFDGTITANAGPHAIPQTFGLGDINETLFFSPARPETLIWGVGPAVTIPTASSSLLGAGKLSLGPSAVALVQPKPWTIGALFRQQWSIIGPNGRTDVNQSLLQPFVSYNLSEGWNLSTGPVITANWSAASAQRWTVPIGGGFGRVFRIGNQPVSAALQAYYNAERPDFAPRWSIRDTFTLLFPE
jgi:hypothetical protein